MDSNSDRPTIYTDPLIIAHQGDTELYRRDNDPPRPQPLSPSVSIQPQRPKTDLSALLPKRASAWQRTYPTALTAHPGNVPAPLANRPPFAPSARGSVNDYPIGNVVYQSLQRPKLLRGGEWQLSVANNLLAAGFGILTLTTWDWHFVLATVFFGWPVQWLIRVLGRHDPKFWAKYLRSVNRLFENHTADRTSPHQLHGYCPNQVSSFTKGIEMKLNLKRSVGKLEQFNVRIPVALKQRLDATRKRAERLDVDFLGTLTATLGEFDTAFNAQLDQEAKPASRTATESVARTLRSNGTDPEHP